MVESTVVLRPLGFGGADCKVLAVAVTPADTSGEPLLFNAQTRKEYRVPGDKLPMDFDVDVDVAVVPLAQSAGAVAPD